MIFKFYCPGLFSRTLNLAFHIKKTFGSTFAWSLDKNIKIVKTRYFINQTFEKIKLNIFDVIGTKTVRKEVEEIQPEVLEKIEFEFQGN